MYTQGWGWGGWESTRSQEYTHKYCLFLACLKAARVWSLLKSPESDSKTSSIRIPAFGFAYAFSHCVDAYDATMCGCLRWMRVFILLTSSGSAPRLIVFNSSMLSSVVCWINAHTRRLYSRRVRCASLEQRLTQVLHIESSLKSLGMGSDFTDASVVSHIS